MQVLSTMSVAGLGEHLVPEGLWTNHTNHSFCARDPVNDGCDLLRAWNLGMIVVNTLALSPLPGSARTGLTIRRRVLHTLLYDLCRTSAAWTHTHTLPLRLLCGTSLLTGPSTTFIFADLCLRQWLARGSSVGGYHTERFVRKHHEIPGKPDDKSLFAVQLLFLRTCHLLLVCVFVFVFHCWLLCDCRLLGPWPCLCLE